MPKEGTFDKGEDLFNKVYKDRLLDSFRDELGWWDRMKLQGALTIYGDKFMPQIADKFSESYKEHNGNIIETLTDLKNRAGDVLKQKGLSRYQKPAQKAIQTLISEENKREHAKIEYIDIVRINDEETRYHHFDYYINPHNQQMHGSYPLNNSQSIGIRDVLEFELLAISMALVLFLFLICIVAMMLSRVWNRWSASDKNQKYHKKEWRQICHDFDEMINQM